MNLTALQNSAFLQSLGWAIANSLWQAAVLWIAYHLVIGVYRNASAKFKNNLSTILLSSAFVWFCITLFNKYFAIEDLSGNYEVQYYNASTITAAVTWNAIINRVTGVLPYLSIAYLLLLIFLSLRLINVYRFTRFIKSHGLQKPGVEWKLFTEKVARHMGITKKIRFWVSHHIDVPATIGFIKPVILIPLASVNQLSADQLEAIILHELSHIKRNDYLINLFISIIETILFFNPFVVLLAKIIKRERENCCDDFVIQYQYDRYAYASALLSLEQFRNINLRLAIGATSGKKQLLVRIKRIMEVNSNTNFNYGQKLAALLLITGVICSVAWLSPQNKETKKQLLSKNPQKVSDKKITRNEKPETLFLSLTESSLTENNKLKNSPVKSQSKKGLTSTEKSLNELRELNLNEIRERKYKLQNRWLQESKKEVVRKNFQKINHNRLFIARGGTSYTPSLFDNGMLLNAALADANIKYQHALTAFDLQKLQLDIDKSQFSFSFDCEQLQNATIKQGFIAKQAKTSIQVHEKFKDIKIENLIKTELKKFEEKNVRRVQVNRIPTTSSGSNSRSFYVLDSLRTSELNITHNHANLPGKGFTKVTHLENKASAELKPSVYGYMHGYDIIITNEKDQKVSENRSAKPNVAATGGKQPPGTKEVSRYTYHIVPHTDYNPAKTNIPKPKTQRRDSIRVEYKNGIIVINGKKIDLAETHDIIAVSLKGKKLLSRAKNIIEPHIVD